MVGIGLECGIPSELPFWSSRRRYPASSLAEAEKGGVFTSPCSHTKGLSLGRIRADAMSYVTYCQPPPNKALQRTPLRGAAELWR